jgi:hypothetical protein
MPLAVSSLPPDGEVTPKKSGMVLHASECSGVNANWWRFKYREQGIPMSAQLLSPYPMIEQGSQGSPPSNTLDIRGRSFEHPGSR